MKNATNAQPEILQRYIRVFQINPNKKWNKKITFKFCCTFSQEIIFAEYFTKFKIKLKNHLFQKVYNGLDEFYRNKLPKLTTTLQMY